MVFTYLLLATFYKNKFTENRKNFTVLLSLSFVDRCTVQILSRQIVFYSAERHFMV